MSSKSLIEGVPSKYFQSFPEARFQDGAPVILLLKARLNDELKAISVIG